MVGKNSAESRELANIRLQLRTGTTRGAKTPRVYNPDEIIALEQRRDKLVAQMANRVAGRVNSHTTHEITRAIGEVNAHTTGALKRALREELCPGIADGATEREELDAMRARRKVEDARMIKLREKVATTKKAEKDERATKKKAAKEMRDAAKKSTEGVAKKSVEAKAVVGEGVCGHVSKAGVVCKRLAPCSSHSKKAHAEAKKMREAAVADAAVVEAAIEPAAEEAVVAAAVVEAAIEPAAEEAVEVVIDAVVCDAEEDDGMAAFLATLPP